MKKSDFNLEKWLVTIEDDIKTSLESTTEAYLVCFTKDGDFIISEVHDGECYVGGDGINYVNDSNIGFDTPEEVERYYKREYADYIVFNEEYDRDEFVEECLS